MSPAPLRVVVTGPDASGKSTLVAGVARVLGAQEGPGSVAVASIWDALGGLLDPDTARGYLARLGDRSRALLLLHAVSRALDLAEAGPARILLLDGYWYKYAVSERAQGAPSALFEACVQDFPRPDLVFVLDLPVEETLHRRPRPSAYEQGLGRMGGDPTAAFTAFQQGLRAGWADLEARLGPWIHLDARRRPDELVEEVHARVDAARR